MRAYSRKIIRLKEVDCDVTEETLTQVVQKAPDIPFFVEVANIEKTDGLLQFIASSNIVHVCAMHAGDATNTIFAVDRNSFAEIAGLLLVCKAEVVIFYFPAKAISFEQFSHNRPTSVMPQKSAVRDGLCSLVCTWITEENRLRFDFDPEAVSEAYLFGNARSI